MNERQVWGSGRERVNGWDWVSLQELPPIIDQIAYRKLTSPACLWPPAQLKDEAVRCWA